MTISNEPRWLVEARKYMGQMEIKGPRHNPLILQFWKDIKRGGIKDDETYGVPLTSGRCLSASESNPPVSSLQNPISTGASNFASQPMDVWWYSVATAAAMSDLWSGSTRMVT